VRVKQGVVAVIVASVFLCCAWLSSAVAQAPNSSIAVLNLRKVFASSEAGKNAQQEMEQKVKELQDKFKKDEDALVALQDEIEKKSSVWSDEKDVPVDFAFRDTPSRSRSMCWVRRVTWLVAFARPEQSALIWTDNRPRSKPGMN